ncbi:TetR/AcrR family transcriptional regulator [Kitasatospora mediocidica]|uniref:TetR/AcrR family transcriptional regulator n=1 Tax=Kitasatospora mediocidica TaxID=58352 RepID=UPI0009FD9079|nr:TetR/AcrR family transcriptional regulator [Kitasatospora mediocidica]
MSAIKAVRSVLAGCAVKAAQAEPATKPTTPRLRADATRNRERILAAAREILSESGAEAPLDEIAKRAGVGNATLYRNFPDRTTLVREVARSVMDRILVQAEQGLVDGSEPFEALKRFVHVAAEERIGALCTMLTAGVDLKQDEQLYAIRARLEEVVEQLMQRARQAGQLRADVGPGDLFVAVAQLTRPLPGTGCLDLGSFVHRHLHLFLDGLRTPTPSELPGRAATLADLRNQPAPVHG